MIAFSLLFLIASIIFLYWVVVTTFPESADKTFLQTILLEVIGSFILGILVFLFGHSWEQKWRENAEKTVLAKQFLALEKNLQLVFSRKESSWNFDNKTPSFYFDGSHINAVYDCLTANNRKWEGFLVQYSEFFKENTKAIEILDFIQIVEQALIVAEKLDKKLKESYIAPELAAKKESSCTGDRMQAMQDADMSYRVIRGYWAKLDPTIIFFGLALAGNDLRLDYSKIANLESDARDIGREREIKSLLLSLQKLRKRLLGIIFKMKT